ncbi:hypothetical protein H4R20_001565 [Coemansia guatemalensis]|uniref:Uncharacterized protein n=1 Tax=Coemansia guatemalensis TaxID=2761395 RepID=A0A9W8HWT1_9FUNG|nr:hypothetical protein H4R20_001565 [Coemansia guatemalensis]
MSVFGRIWRDWANRRPLLTLSLTNGAICGIGDTIAQLVAPPPALFQHAEPSKTTPSKIGSAPVQDYSLWRTFRFCIYGCAFGPVAHKWYSLLDRSFPFFKIAHATSAFRWPILAGWVATTGKRVAVDQIFFAPAAVAAFFIGMGLMEGKTFGEIREHLRERYFGALAGNYALWPAAQIVNFSLIPLVYRVPFSGMVGIMWNFYLSWINSRPEKKTTLAAS